MPITVGQYLTKLYVEHLGFTFLAHPVYMGYVSFTETTWRRRRSGEGGALCCFCHRAQVTLDTPLTQFKYCFRRPLIQSEKISEIDLDVPTWELQWEDVCLTTMVRRNNKLSYCIKTARRESLPKIAENRWNLRMSFKFIKSGTNRKLVYDFLLVLCSNFCRVTHRLREIWCETV